MSAAVSRAVRLVVASLLGISCGWYLTGSAIWTVCFSLFVVAAVIYLPLLLDEPEFLPPQTGGAAGGRAAGRANIDQPAALPRLRPPEGAVTAGAPGRHSDEERAGFLRTLAEGPDFRRAPAAVALSLHCADSDDIEVTAALLAALRNDDYEVLVRVEALLAIYRVSGQLVPTLAESDLRQRFPRGVDWEFVNACQRRVDGAAG